MRLYRCSACGCGFAIFLKRGKENRGGKGITCPLCGSSKKVSEVDPVESVGATIARKAWELWKAIPSGDD